MRGHYTILMLKIMAISNSSSVTYVIALSLPRHILASCVLGTCWKIWSVMEKPGFRMEDVTPEPESS